MIGWPHGSGVWGWWKYYIYLAAFLPGERTPRCALAGSDVTYVRLLLVFIPVTSLSYYCVRSTGKPSTLRRDHEQTIVYIIAEKRPSCEFD